MMRTEEGGQERWMRIALKLAGRGRGRVSPNPLVGAVLVRDGEQVGEGYHIYSRRHHAEAVALQKAGDLARGADLYVNLEPCCHQGRTPPCAKAVVEAGIKRVFVAVEDPNPLVKGKGIEFLRKHGVVVEVGLCRDMALRLNEAFFHFIATRRPFVSLKLALTLDGKLAAKNGDSKWITGPSSRRYVQALRFNTDALLVGIGTVLADDPSLNVRGRRRKEITKVILDSRLRCPSGARLFLSEDPVVIFHGPEAAAKDIHRLEEQAVLVEVTLGRAGLDWKPVLEELGRRWMVHLLVEGGSRVAASLVASRRVDRLNLIYAPKLLGGEGISGIAPLGIEGLQDAVQLTRPTLRRFGEDFLVGVRLPKH